MKSFTSISKIDIAIVTIPEVHADVSFMDSHFQYLEWDYRNRYDRSDRWTFFSNRNNRIKASLTASLI